MNEYFMSLPIKSPQILYSCHKYNRLLFSTLMAFDDLLKASKVLQVMCSGVHIIQQ